ncbi:alpha/beta hydrolase [candidate division KSB1 bacterium]|nr:alpha/beta hydrolase [candidate division KSB1 bacterium]
MPETMTIRVIYPLQDGRIVLRVDDDWNHNVEAASRNNERTIFEFHVTTNQPYLYFKPCIEDRNGWHWSQGNNYLAVVNAAEAKEIYPHFFSSLAGTISEPIDFYSHILNNSHRLRLYYPPGYEENTLKRYPVLYMHDGQNLFFPEEAFFNNEWRIDETMNRLDAMNVIDKVIVVGIYPQDRMYEYTQPGYESFGRFLVEELKREVDANLRTLATAANTAVMGSSLGGVVSLYLAWQYPHVFGKAACLSSTFTYRDDLMQRITREPKRELQIYLDSGWPEDNYEVTRSMRDLLLRQGFVAGRDLLYFAFPEALHSEAHWATRSHIPFQFFFGKAPKFGAS